MFYYKPHYLTKELGELGCQVIPHPPGSSVERAQDYKAYPCILKTPVISRPRTMLFWLLHLLVHGLVGVEAGPVLL